MKRRKRSTIALLALMLFASSCTTTERRDVGGAIATTSAIVVALPLIPFGVAYNLISNESNREREAERKLKEVLDPVYLKRITMIQQRDPAADARQSWSNGSDALLPSSLNSNIFPGIEATAPLFSATFASENRTKLQRSELATYLETLTGDDPFQLQNRDVIYLSETYKQFLRVSWIYREAYNKEMYARMANSQPVGQQHP